MSDAIPLVWTDAWLLHAILLAATQDGKASLDEVVGAADMIQHAMLTCREYGVPAVFQTKDATRRLREGQRVTVDATRGWVLPAP